MQTGFLLESARSNARRRVRSAVVMFAVCVVLLLINGKFIYNCIAGPFPMTPQLAEFSGSKEWVRIGSGMVYTGLADQKTTTLRILGKLAETRSTDITAHYYLAPLDDNQFILIKTEPDFSGQSAEGRLVPLPDKIRVSPVLKTVKVKDGVPLEVSMLYGRMVDATIGYRADGNLFVYLAIFFLFGSLGMMVAYLPKITHPEKHPMMRYIARKGGVLSTVRLVEKDIVAAGDNAHAGPLYVSESWIVDPSPKNALIFPIKDVVAVMKKVNVTRKPPVFSLEFWLRDEARPHSVKASNEECDAALLRLRSVIPWAIVEMGSSLELRWTSDRRGCIADMEARKKLHQGALLAK